MIELYSLVFLCNLLSVLSFDIGKSGNKTYNVGRTRADCNAPNRANIYHDEELFDLWKEFSIFSMENSMNISHSCAEGVQRFVEGIRKADVNSLKMFDATGKLPAGILRGNINQFGDFDECLSIEEAQYCLAEIDLNKNWKFPYARFKNEVHSYYAIRETFDDVKHRVPGFSMVRWGFCIPKECSPGDLEASLKQKGIIARIKSSMCQTSRNESKVVGGQKITKYIFTLISIITILATTRNWFLNGKPLSQSRFEKFVDCFDGRKNLDDLTVVSDSKNDVNCLHGIRALSALALLISHKTMALFYNPYINKAVMAANLGMKWSVIGRTAILYTDCFMLISGFLNAKSLFRELDKCKTTKFGEKLTSRIFRITPNVAAVILFCTYILPTLDAGPLWPVVVEHHAHLCKKNMWRNLLYIHNYFPFQDMCLTHTHQVGIDMQLFLVTPIMVYTIWRWRSLGLWLLALITVGSTILRFVVTWLYNLSHVVHFGITITRMFDTANLSYILPTHRATIYFMGVYLAYILRDKSEIILSKVQLAFFWTVFMCFGFGTWLGPMHMSQIEYEYNKIDAAFYAAFSPILWGSAVAWTIYATEKGYGGFFGALLSWNKFKYFTKISYAVYLVQFPLFFYNVGRTKHVDEFTISHMFKLTETVEVIMLAIGLTVFIEIPFQKVGRIILDACGKETVPGKSTIDVNQNNTATQFKTK